MKISFWLICFLFLQVAALAQNIAGKVSYGIQKSDSPITADGILDEPTWEQAERGGGFWQSFPTDNTPAQDSTQFMVTYDDDFLYLAVICYDYLPGEPITTTLKRDFNWMANDNISFYIDPFNDKTNGFAFQLTPDNVQREGLVTLGGDVADDWDNKWFSGTSKGDNFWIAEMAIPFKSIRFNSVPEWNLQFIRNNQKRNERTVWIQVPQRFRSSDLLYSGQLVWDTPPPEAGTNLTVIPYTTLNTGRDFEAGELTQSAVDAGFDAKIGLTNSLNLDLTFNPDFSQVEVDQQVTNLQRFELFFPERRQFFLENQDLFSGNGFPPSRPFFSRRIGIQGSGSTQRNVPILGGARLSGKLGDKMRVGVLNIVSREDEFVSQDGEDKNISPAQNYSVAIIERQIMDRSRLSAIFVGRTNLGKAALDSFRVENGNVFNEKGDEVNAQDTLISLSEYNYVYGLNYDLASSNNKWNGRFFYHRSADPVAKTDNVSHGRFMEFQTTNVRIGAYHLYTGDNYNAEVGFVQRTGVMYYGVETEYNFFTEGAIQRHGPNVEIRRVSDNHWNVLDKELDANYTLSFLNRSQIRVGYGWQSVLLQGTFDPSGTDGEELPENTEYSFGNGYISYESDNRKPFNFEIFAGTGNYFNGTRSAVGGEINFRFQPILQIGVEAEYNAIELPEPYNDADLLLLSPRIDLTLTNKVFFTSFLQYNTQDRNFSQNHRFQWRFKPVSDLFIVYTDNYITTPNWETRNRALVVKLSYWLNL